MAELSGKAGVPVATIKYYLREGLLPPGERTSPNQAKYDDGHVQRIKLIRALMDVGGLALTTVGEVLAAVDAGGADPHHVLGIAQQGITISKQIVDDEARDWALATVRGLAKRRGWPRKSEDDPIIQALVGVLCAIREVGHGWYFDKLDDYAEIADRTADLDLESLAGIESLERIIEIAVVETVLSDRLLSSLRRLAQQRASKAYFGRLAVDD
ncbi:MerR family transcriptional regulator [Amycolatopsis coloradensis]|uniref:MerR family transcriptional regulator n=1 Tax=Amycolatopsis coloradensis TaxID=76021 RepID=A0A1R0KPR7_9PSEU|nr:MerR family transcriptional regulator [Amycolatopsis coloradensis]OLZ49172.1 MerR family transcriptional regulator [Amycolatopsis coloradensis]